MTSLTAREGGFSKIVPNCDKGGGGSDEKVMSPCKKIYFQIHMFAFVAYRNLLHYLYLLEHESYIRIYVRQFHDGSPTSDKERLCPIRHFHTIEGLIKLLLKVINEHKHFPCV